MQKQSKRKGVAILLAVTVLLLTIYLAGKYLYKLSNNPLSEDAVIKANVVHISSSLPGRIKQMNVQEGQYVKKGDLLFTVDPEFYGLRVEQAKAELRLAKATLDMKLRGLQAEEHNAIIAQEQTARARSNLEMATQSEKRLSNLAAKGYVSKQQHDEANTLAKDAQISLNQALEQAQAAQALLGNTDAEQAMVEMRQAGLAMAERDLEETHIHAPHNGRIVGLNVGSGEHLLPGVSVFTLIDTNSWYATGMYLETDLKRIRPNDCATVYVLADSSRKFKGRVNQIGWGVSSELEIDLPRSLPYVQKSLNWVRVAQRFPVHIKIEEPDEHLMRAGASAITIIHSDDDC